jgi:hypothetical protein
MNHNEQTNFCCTAQDMGIKAKHALQLLIRTFGGEQVSKMDTVLRMMGYAVVSNCCSEPFYMDTDVCKKCKEHSDFDFIDSEGNDVFAKDHTVEKVPIEKFRKCFPLDTEDDIVEMAYKVYLAYFNKFADKYEGLKIFAEKRGSQAKFVLDIKENINCSTTLASAFAQLHFEKIVVP